jgi:EAL domain-containing protein (putative c-di-GMP-specific phosphodiesterase class I)
LYHAKETGRGGFVRYWPGIGSAITHRQDAIRSLSTALNEDRVEAHYQPVVRLDTREIVGLEALCRIRTRHGALVPAQRFQEATADVQVAAALTERMLSAVAADVRSWVDEGLHLQHVSVNVSPADFYAGSLVQKAAKAFSRAGVPLSKLILEVSESVYLNGRDRVVPVEIKALRKAGVRVALDDFGTGYASLTHLLDVPVDIIKIDRSFVARLSPGDPSTVIVAALVSIAQQLNIKVVAEGVETERQAGQLAAMGCKLGQGYVFSRAVDSKSAAELLRLHGKAEGAAPLPSPQERGAESRRRTA